MKKLILNLFLFSSFPIFLFGQSDVVNGKVVNISNNLPLVKAQIIVYKKSNIVWHVESDSLGKFNIPYNHLRSLDSVKITALNFKDLVIKDRKTFENAQSLGVFKLSPNYIELSEVRVTAIRRYRDTTKIDLSNKIFERSVMTDELFSKEFNFYKDKGVLYYNGKIVSDVKVNGGDFFGKGNLDIYQLLPAMALKGFEVIETNIDSVTNVTTLQPSIKLNFNLKEKYAKGILGNYHAGVGTTKRILLGTDLYFYKNSQQLSLGFNRNNINIQNLTPIEPIITFSPNGNNSTVNISKISYRFMLSKKIEINLSAKGRNESRQEIIQSKRQDKSINQFSETNNQITSQTFELPESKFTIDYKIDSLNTFTFNQSLVYNKTNLKALSNYLIQSDNSNSVSNLIKKQTILKKSSITELFYNRKFAKAGRLLNIKLFHDKFINKNNEVDSIYNASQTNSKSYFVKGDRNLSQYSYNAEINYTEPIDDESFLNVFSKYKNSQISYIPSMESDSIKNLNNVAATVLNKFYRLGINFHSNQKTLSLDGLGEGVINFRQNNGVNNLSFINLNLKFRADYHPASERQYILTYTKTANYPDANQLINVNPSFDLISQTTGNLNIKPEVLHNLIFEYTNKKSASKAITLNASFDYYISKFGMAVSALPNTTQITYITNIGNAIATRLGGSFQKHVFKNFYLTFNSNITYQEQPTFINNILNLNNGITFNQSISTNTEIIKDVLSISPIITGTYAAYFYQSSSVNVLTLTYSDKFSLKSGKFQFDLYPLMNYNHNLGSDIVSFSINGAIKRSLFKNQGSIWLQGYDILNSFKFYNNIISPSYTQTVQHSNLKQYFILGLSLKFNTIR